MKKCDQIRELILTEYIDGLSNAETTSFLESHLLDCSHCRTFFKEVKNNAVAPLRQAAQQPVPVELWASIKENIEARQVSQNPLEELVERLKDLLVFPKIVPVFASVVLMMMVGTVSLNTIQNQAQDKDQGEYLVSLLSPADVAQASDSNEGNNPIEQYFL